MKRRWPVLLAYSLVTALSGEAVDEMQRYRQIAEKPAATVQDMVDLVLMSRGEFLKHKTEAARFEFARGEGWVKGRQPADTLDRGALAFAIVLNYQITQGWLFRLTQLNRYALRDAQEAGILSLRLSELNSVSGSQLVGAISAAEEYKTQKEEWSSHH